MLLQEVNLGYTVYTNYQYGIKSIKKMFGKISRVFGGNWEGNQRQLQSQIFTKF